METEFRDAHDVLEVTESEFRNAHDIVEVLEVHQVDGLGLWSNSHWDVCILQVDQAISHPNCSVARKPTRIVPCGSTSHQVHHAVRCLFKRTVSSKPTGGVSCSSTSHFLKLYKIEL